jgi:hypothetical protein
VLFVTNLEDSGAGSLREAIETQGARTVLFRVGGVISLKKALQVREPFLTIAGQTAPGDGICLQGAPDSLTLLNTHDVVVRHLRVRTGYTGEGDAHEGDAISCYQSRDFIFDHCSTSWGTDETFSCTQGCDRYTVQWCVIAECLNFYGHSMASIIGGSRSSWHHNLIAHCRTRNPRFAAVAQCDFRNNVIYDWGDTAGYGEFAAVNYVGNYLKPGPSTTQRPTRFLREDGFAMPAVLYLTGNELEGNADATRDNQLGAVFDAQAYAGAPHVFPAVATQPAREARNRVLDAAGATAPKRDGVDARLVEEFKNGTGKVISHEREVGGVPAYAGAEAPKDSDMDGIPDAWERTHGLNPTDPADAQKVQPDGYTALEHYLNALADKMVR